jgi:hypothetical protein
MKVDLLLANARIYNIFEVMDIKLGEKFSLITDSTVGVLWFANNDPALAIKEGPTSAELEATATGTADILIMDQGLAIIKKLVINVVADVNPAVALVLTADAAVPK